MKYVGKYRDIGGTVFLGFRFLDIGLCGYFKMCVHNSDITSFILLNTLLVMV
jgi:hypothetical protein